MKKEKESYHDEIRRHWRAAAKAKDAEAMAYYGQAFGLSACASFEVFKGSWAYESWVKRNVESINKIKESFKKWSWMN
jgi:hypothetical protein